MSHTYVSYQKSKAVFFTLKEIAKGYREDFWMGGRMTMFETIIGEKCEVWEKGKRTRRQKRKSI